jgi:hypothetical protein
MEAAMSGKHVWDEAADRKLRDLRWAGTTWDAIAAEMGLGRWVVLERGRKLGVRRRPREFTVQETADCPCRPAGHPDTWGLLVKDTVLEGSPYPFPVFL